MDAADPRIDHLSGTDGNGNDLVYGVLKRREAPVWMPLFLYYGLVQVWVS